MSKITSDDSLFLKPADASAGRPSRAEDLADPEIGSAEVTQRHHKKDGGEKLTIFDFFGETPEKPDDSDESEPRKVERAAQGLSENQEKLFRAIVGKLEDDYDRYEHLPDSKEEHLAALMYHARAEDATYGSGKHHINGYDQALVRWTYRKYMKDWLGFDLAMSPKKKREISIWPELEVEEVGLLKKHDEFRPVIRVRRSDGSGIETKTEVIRADDTYRTPLHALQWIEEKLDSLKYSVDLYAPVGE